MWATLEQLRARRSVKWRRHPADVLPLFVAEMDVALAEPIATALARAVADGDVGYAHPAGLAEAFAGFAHDRFGWLVDPGRVALIPDVVQGLRAVLELVTAPGDGVVVNAPAYPPFYAFVAAAGRRIVSSPLARDADGRYHLDLDALDRDLARPDVQVYLLCHPHNPTGLVLRPDELVQIGEIATRHGVTLLSDEIHAPLTYPGVVHTPLAHVGVPGVITFASASKAWNLPGLKAALAVASDPAGQSILDRLPEELPFGSGLLGVLASEVAFTAGRAWLEELLVALDGNRRYLGQLLARHLPTVRYAVPDATYLAWLDCTALDLGDDPATAFLHTAAVALHSGPSFGDGGTGFARLNFATSPSILDEAVARMARAVSS
jgi:cystathionine beta-lyase